jgi:hypothetical protein
VLQVAHTLSAVASSSRVSGCSGSVGSFDSGLGMVVTFLFVSDGCAPVEPLASRFRISNGQFKGMALRLMFDASLQTPWAYDTICSIRLQLDERMAHRDHLVRGTIANSPFSIEIPPSTSGLAMMSVACASR